MVLAKVVFQRVIVDIVLLLATAIVSVTNVAAFVLVSAVCVELVVSIESLSAETTLGVSLESTLIDRARIVVAELLMLAQFREREKFMFVRENFLVPCAKVASLGQQSCDKTWYAYHMTLPCAVLTWRCRSGQPKHATSQFSSGQLYCNNRRVSSNTCGFSKCMPKLSFD
jgi:hypothetical protein